MLTLTPCLFKLHYIEIFRQTLNVFTLHHGDGNIHFQYTVFADTVFHASITHTELSTKTIILTTIYMAPLHGHAAAKAPHKQLIIRMSLSK